MVIDLSVAMGDRDVAAFGDTVAVRTGTYPSSFVPVDGVAILGGYDATFTTRDHGRSRCVRRSVLKAQQ